MILGVGNDVVEIARFERMHAAYPARTERRLFTPAEIAHAEGRGPRKPRTLALRFAAKEAAAKALGTGFRGGIRFLDIEVVTDALGKPHLALHGAAQARLMAMLPADHRAQLHLALSDEGEFAWAVAVVEALAA